MNARSHHDKRDERHAHKKKESVFDKLDGNVNRMVFLLVASAANCLAIIIFRGWRGSKLDDDDEKRTQKNKRQKSKR